VSDFDLAIVGGGVNGCGMARDAAGRGARVVLFEQGDLAQGTSWASTKLIHGGLRYLEHYEFRLVRESLAEREVLWGIAPHIIRPLRFVLPHHRALRPRWMLGLGLFLYDHLGGRKRLPPTCTLDLRRDPAGAPLKPEFRHAFEYSDAAVDDARLVALNALDAARRGADIRPRTKLVSAHRDGELWRLTAQSHDGARQEVTAKALFNAAGPWVGQVLGLMGANAPARVRLVRGSHIVVRKLFDHDRAYIFQNGDGRVIFAIPYEGDFTLIGTTDRDHDGDAAEVAASEEEITYLCEAVSDYFARPVTPTDVVWTYSGVRPLLDDGSSPAQEATRDYLLHLDAPPGGAPLLSAFGGKITTYRRLAEAALADLAPFLPAARKPRWTGQAALPGGDFPIEGFEALANALATQYPGLPPPLVRRLAHAYGTETRGILGSARTLDDLGQLFLADLTEAEVRHLMANEWARTADDVLWRRSKLGLRADPAGLAALEAFMEGSLYKTRHGGRSP